MISINSTRILRVSSSKEPSSTADIVDQVAEADIQCQVIVPLLHALPSQHLTLVGSSTSLGCWKPSGGLRLTRQGDSWSGVIPASSKATEAKLVLVDEATSEVVWEAGCDRMIPQVNSSALLILHWGLPSQSKLLPLASGSALEPASSLLEFEVPSYKTHPGQSLKVVGSIPQLGGWDPAKGLALEWKPGHAWSASLTLPSHDQMEAKVIVEENGRCTWEPGCNRKIDLNAQIKGESSEGHVTLHWGCTEVSPLIIVPTSSNNAKTTQPSKVDAGQEADGSEQGSLVRFLSLALSGFSLNEPLPAKSAKPSVEEKELIAVFKSEIDSLKKKLETAHEDLLSARQEGISENIIQSSSSYQMLLAENKALKSKSTDLEERIKSLSSSSEKERSILSSQLSQAHNRIAETQSLIERLTYDSKSFETDMEEKVLSLQRKLLSAEKAKIDLEQSLTQESVAKISAMSSTIDELEQAQAAYAKASLDSAKVEKSLRGQLSDASVKRDVALVELEKARQEVAVSTKDMKSKLVSMEKKAEMDALAWVEKSSALEAQLAVKREEIESFAAQRMAYMSSIEKIEGELAAALASMQVLSSKVEILQARVDSNAQTIKMLEGEKEKLEVLLKKERARVMVNSPVASSPVVQVRGGEIADLRRELLSMQNQVAEVKAEEIKRRVEEVTKLRKDFETRLASQRNLLLAAKASDVNNLTQKHGAEEAVLMAQIKQQQQQIESLRADLAALNNIVPFDESNKSSSASTEKKAGRNVFGWLFGNKAPIAAAAKEDDDLIAPAPPMAKLQAKEATQRPAAADVIARPKPDLVDYLDLVD